MQTENMTDTPFTILVSILCKCSLIAEEDFLVVIENILKKGVMDKLGFIKLYRDVYLGIYGDEKISISTIDEKFDVFNEKQEFKNNNIIEIFKYEELANNYDENQIKNDIKKRYENTLMLLKPTLATLNKDVFFRNTIISLQEMGYKDWEILSSLANMFMECKAKQALAVGGIILIDGKINPSFTQELMKAKMFDIRDNPEKYNDPIKDKKNGLMQIT